MSAVFDTSFSSGSAVFDTSFSGAVVALTVITDLDTGNIQASSVVVIGADTPAPTVYVDRREATLDYRHFLFAVEGAEGKTPTFQINRDTRAVSLPGADCIPLWTQDFETFVRAPSRTLVSGTPNLIQWQFTAPLPAGRVYVVSHPLGRQQDAEAYIAHLLSARSDIAAPTASSGPDGVFATSPAETDETGRAIGSHPMMAVQLSFPGPTSDGGPKRKLVMTTQTHAAGESPSYYTFRRAMDWICDSASAEAVDFRANWDVFVYSNVTPNGLYGGHRRTNFRSSVDPNRDYVLSGSSVLAEITALRAAIETDTGGACDAFYAWHGFATYASLFVVGTDPEDFSAGTRTAAAQSMLDIGATVFGVPAAVETSGTNNTGCWWAKAKLGAKVSFDVEQQQNGSTNPDSFAFVGESWMKTLQALDAAGEFWESTGAASGELHTTLTDITATLEGTAGGAGVSGELHATLSDVTASITGASTASGELHAVTSDVIATLAGYVTITGELHATVSDIIATLTGISLGPAGVDIDIVKRWCRIDGSEFDAILPMMIESAVAIAEQETGRDYHADEMQAAVLQFVCAHVSYWINTPDAALEKSMMPSPFVARLLDPYRLWELT